jgi:hypothetical protein
MPNNQSNVDFRAELIGAVYYLVETSMDLRDFNRSEEAAF